MNALVIVEIVIGVLLALGIAIAALRTFIKGKDKRPGLLIGSSTIAVLLLIVCLVCTGIQINRNSSETAETEVEELSQVRVESVEKEEKNSEKADIAAKAAVIAESQAEKMEQDAEAEREKNKAELLAAFFGGTEKPADDTESKSVKALTDNVDNINAAAFTVGVPVYTEQEEESDVYSPEYENSSDTDYYEEDSYDYSADNEANNNFLADYFGSYESGDQSYSYEDESYYGYYENEQSDYSYDYEEPSDYAYEEPYSEPETEYTYTEPDYSYTEPDYSYTEPETEAYEEPQSEDTYVWDGSVLSRGSGVNYGPLGLETYYNMDMSGVVAMMRSMGYSEEEYPYYVREDGCKMLGGYIMVAANFSQFSRGDIVQCSLGAAIVCDTGAGGWNWLDIATNW